MQGLPDRIVINTGPIIALACGLDDLGAVLDGYRGVIVPFAVRQEIQAGGATLPGMAVLEYGDPISLQTRDPDIRSDLAASLDPGEAAVIQTSIDLKIPWVCIDEIIGRRVARLNSLHVTGSLGLMIRAVLRGAEIDIERSIGRMKNHGIWVSADLESQAIRLARRLDTRS